MLTLYRTALASRRTLAADMAPTLTWLGGPEGVLAFARGNFGCALNLSAEPVTAIGPVLLSSAPVADGLVPPDTAVWTSGLPGADQAAQHTVDE
jgi:alpha-glucosidase